MSEPTHAVSPEVPVCPRHPDRVSYVRCQRCGRPVCPECQRPAAVGVHCVDCVREASRNAPQARTAFGAPLRRGAPVVTYTVIGLNVLVYLLEQALGPTWTLSLALRPALVGAHPWIMLTSAFLHASVIHIGFNMYALWILGQYLEVALGRWRFLTAYLVSAFGGSAVLVLMADPAATAWIRPSLGASGAVFGLFGLILVVLRRLGRNATSIVVVVGINAVLGFVIPNIAWQAHLGGLLTGLVLGLAFAYAPRHARVPVAVGSAAALVVLLAVLTVAKLSTAGAL
jgi:membrane associated rhomboid family serine protease